MINIFCSPYEKIRARNIEEKEKLAYKLFGDKPSESQNPKKREQNLRKLKPNNNGCRKSKRLKEQEISEIFSCPVCFETFEEISDNLKAHFNSHFQ